jgi:hypothetical protein
VRTSAGGTGSSNDDRAADTTSGDGTARRGDTRGDDTASSGDRIADSDDPTDRGTAADGDDTSGGDGAADDNTSTADGDGGADGGDGDESSAAFGVLERSGDFWSVGGRTVYVGDQSYLESQALNDFDGQDGVESNIGELETLLGMRSTWSSTKRPKPSSS